MIVIKKICQLKIVYHLLISSNITSPTSTRIVTFSKLQILDKYLYKIEIRLRTTRRCQGKRAKLQMGVSRKQSPPNFLKNEHFLPPDTNMYVFQKIWRALFSWNTRLEITLFALLPTYCVETGLESRSTLETDPKSHILFHSLFDDKDKAVAGIL